jgi:glycosyltransferase involved in cell wall biosynthesis
MSIKVTIITVVKNDEKFILRTLNSIEKQNYNNIEHIIIDGKSTDHTLSKIKSFKKKNQIIISEQDLGIYDAMNKGIKLASGDIIAFCNSGDLIKKRGISLIVNYFKKNKDLDFLFAGVWRFYKGSKIKKNTFSPKRIHYNFDCYTAHSTGFYIKKTSQNKLGFYNLDFKCSADYDLFYRMIVKMKMTGLCTKKNEIVGLVKSGGFSSKFTYLDHLIEETRIRIHNKQNIIWVILIFLIHYFKNLKKIF